MASTYDIGYINPDTNEVNPPIIQGSTFELPFTITNIFSNSGSGCIIRGMLRPSYSSSIDYLFTTTITDTTSDLLTCMVMLSADDSAAIPAKDNYVYDIEIEDDSGFVIKPLRGKAKVLAEVTK